MENREDSSDVKDKKIPVDERYLQGINAWNNKDYERAFKIWRECAEENHCYSLYGLGMCYEFGYYVPKDIQTALKCYQLAFDNGYKSAAEKIETLKAKVYEIPVPQINPVRIPECPSKDKSSIWSFSPEGRINRESYITFNVISFTLSFVTFLLVNLMQFIGKTPFDTFSLILVLLLIPFVPLIVLQILNNIKRLHDIDASGHFCWLYFLSFLFFGIGPLIYTIVMCCIPGTKGANKYGEEPV